MGRRARTLAGASRVVGGEPYKIVLAGNGWRATSAEADGAEATIKPLPGDEGLLRLSLMPPTAAWFAGGCDLPADAAGKFQ